MSLATNVMWLKQAMLLCVLFFGHPAQATPQPEPNPALIRVLVHTDNSGDRAELTARRESVKDLADSLAGKKKTIAIVTDEDVADVVIEVVDRSSTVPRVVFGVGARPGQPPGGNVPMRAALLRVTLRWADEPFDFKNQNTVAETRPGWRSAADDLAKQIEKWIVDRKAAILRRR